MTISEIKVKNDLWSIKQGNRCTDLMIVELEKRKSQLERLQKYPEDEEVKKIIGSGKETIRGLAKCVKVGNELAKKYIEVIKKLPSIQQVVIHQHYIQGYSYEKIAGNLHYSVSRIKKISKQGICQMAKEMSEDERDII